MARPLTPIAIANLKPRPKRYEVPDPGCAGLRVVVFPSRRKSFVVRYRFRGLQRKLTLGPCMTERGVAEPTSAPETATPLSLLAARSLCAEALRQARSGNDPAAAKQRKRQQERAAESDTLAAIAAEYLRREGPRLRTIQQRRSDLDLLCASVLGRQPVAGITRGQYTRILDHIADNNGPVRSDRCLSALRTLLSWHSARSDFISPLVRGGRRTSISERARSRVLDDDELKAVVMTAEAEQRKGNPFGAFVLFLLHTATRRSEAAGLRRRSELSDGGAVWTIPGGRYKSGKDTLIPLSAAAQAIIAAQPVLGDFVFSADGSHPLVGFDDRKKDFDKVCGVQNYVLHDLRRTARTLLSRAGIGADVAEMCLGHALTGVRATYDRFAYFDQKKQAFEALAALIARIVHGPEPAVADITVERKRHRVTAQP
jgi:integrase